MIAYNMAGILVPALLMTIFILLCSAYPDLNNPLQRDVANSSELTYMLTDIDMRCPEGWERDGSKCFRVYYLERSWPQALIFCGRYGSLLARIESQRENAFIARMLNRPQRSASATTKIDYWIGLISQESGDDDAFFLWSDGTLVSRYIGFWGKGQPDYRTGSCAKATFANPTSLFWNLEMCNMLLPFVCELPACIKGSFFCHNGGCIPESAHCNGIDDCGDLSDELNCPASHNELACFKYEKGESGKILSPNYPSSYRPNAHCRWVIEGPISSRIQLTFEEFETEENMDLVTVVDGGPSENASVVIDTISGSPKPERLSFVSGTNMMVIRFRADALVQARGFQASWRAVSLSCGGTLKAQLYEQSFSSPEYPQNYPNGMECVWRIDAPEGQLISLNVQDFELEDQRDFVVVYDGPTPSSQVLARLTGRLSNTSSGAVQLIVSSQNVLYIYFYSNYAIGGKGFAMSYKRGCDNTIKQNYGVLLSPGHTQVPYPGSQTCKYTIMLSDEQNDQPISISINHFDVAKDDYLQVYEGGEYGRALHNDNGFNEDHRPPKMLHSKQSQVQLVFTSNAVRNTMGWNLTFSTNCPALHAPKMVSTSTQNTAFGTKVTIACPIGFEFVSGRGQRFDVQCKLGGKWTEDMIPTCQPIYCSAVPQIANGFAVSATNVSFGGMAKYSCYDGFAFESGKKMEEIFCTDEGRWTKTPKCRAATCPALEHFEHGDRQLKFGDGTGYGTVFAFECEPGYRRVGAATMLCQTNGKWSTEQPKCQKLSCTNIPKIQHGRIALDAPWLDFGESVKIECEPGFRNVGSDAVKCLANQTLSGSAECQDIDECVDGTANCSPKSTVCVNMPGGYHCQCQKGYQPQLACTNSASLIPNKGEASSEDTKFRYFSYNSGGWCAQADDKTPIITLTLSVLKVIDRVRFEKVGNSYPTLKKLGASGSELLVLHTPIEARVVQLEILEFHERACVKFDLLGCQKASCVDENECEKHNGHCEHHCMNTQGSYRCSCEEGYDLFMFDGQGGVHVKEGETGEDLYDTFRFNKSCIPNQCPAMTSPLNGQLISTSDQFHFPMVVEFRCNFGFQMMGPTHLKCLADGTWNGTTPVCIAANCDPVQNNSAIGLFVQSETGSGPVPFGHNVSIMCSQQNRPAKTSPLSSFRQCIYDPQTDGREYWLSGNRIDCPLVDCGPPPVLAGAFYEGEENSFKVGSAYNFGCRPPYQLLGKSSYDDRVVRCNVDGSWDLGSLRCEGPVCVDPGHPDDGETVLESVEEGAIARFKCNRPGYEPYPWQAINCTLGTACVLSEDVGISSGFIPDGAFADNSETTTWGYEPHKARMSSTGWCGSKDAFIFLSVDLQRIYTLTTLRIAGVAGSGHLKGHVTKMQLFYKVQFSNSYDTYPIEFEIPSGNHNKMYQFELNPPLRARYVLLGITEYETNPCLKFDMQGCLAPLSAAHEIPSHLQVGWNASVPQCIDAEPPVFHNCPQNPIYITTDDHGQLTPASFEVPQATDNSGFIAFMRVRPSKFEPPRPVDHDLDVVYTAFDEAGNSAECVVKLRIPDTQPPVMKCPDSYTIAAKPGQTEQLVYFNESTVPMVVQDMSNITEIVFDPLRAVIKLGSHVDVEVTATDAHANKNKCKFQVAFMQESCSEMSLPAADNVEKFCVKQSNGLICKIQCKEGYRFVDPWTDPNTHRYTCANGVWSPNNNPPACVRIAQEPARYELNVAIKYPVSTNVGQECLKGYTDLVAAFFDTMDTVLTQRCSSSVQVFVRFLDVKFTSSHNEVVANYTIQILPTVLQDVFYELCGLTLRTIFDLRIPGASGPIRNVLAISGETIATPGNGCPSLNASTTSVSQGFGCADGEILLGGNEKEKGTLPECLPCPKGTVYVNNTCVPCPVGSYQDEEGHLTCKACPDHTFTLFPGAQTLESCIAVCGNGMYSDTGLIPCQLCPRHTFAGPPVFGGFKKCESCADGTYTARLGSTGPSQCKQPCQPGFFSISGLEPCSPCPVNHYQPSLGQQRCIECPNNTNTKELGKSLEAHCEKLNCTSIKCQNKASCAIVNHKAICECRPGYTGSFCEEQVALCDSEPCYNGGRCESVAGTFRCICPPNYTGTRCQFGPDECIGINCPNGGVCQDLPGLGTTKCICRTGFTGLDCSQVADPCQMDNPCKNGADCIPLQLGRYKCKCLPGWEGQNCDRNIDDCASQPCALGSACHDLVNDFQCDCPHGFRGKRCNIKDNLCNPNPCVNGLCVDTLFDRQCVCKPGWTGAFCDVNIDDCMEKPCLNGATCTDKENGYECKCSSGFHGSKCQHMDDHCATQPCRNNATCINKGARYECQCKLGFEGAHCEHNIKECEVAEQRCEQHGTELCEDLVNGFRCQCRVGFTGEFCEVHINQCVSQPCQNNGTCIDLGSTFRCECPKGWRGDHCEIEAGACDQKPCKNDGRCVNLMGDYFCVCPEGVNGKNCEIAPNRCIGEPCHNGGVCGDFGSHLECNCAKGFVGEGCQYKLDACHGGKCKNGATCLQQGTDYKCLCAPGFTGTDCETNVDNCSPNPCPMTATCIDQVNGHYCQCPFNMTGANCDKKVDPDYDVHFYDGILPAQAALTMPFRISTKALSLSLWVKFDTAHSKGTVFTLYNSEASTYPSKVTELVQISADSVRIALFSDETALHLHFPSNQRLNDGNWNNLVITWTSHGGAYSLVWNAVRLYADKGYGRKKTLDINAWINLGHPLEAPATDPKFIGSVTRINMWDRVLDFEHDIPAIVHKCQNSQIIMDGLILQFTGYDRLSGKVEKITRSTCGRDKCRGSRCSAKEPSDLITVESCPGDVFVVTPLKEVNVTWPDPVFSSVNPILRIEQNLKPGQVFNWGEFMVLYVAYDNETNSAQCVFKVHVSPDFCPDLEDPVHGIQACEYWGPDLKFRACSIQCENGYEFSQSPAVFYTCAGDGVWRPRVDNSYHFRYPQCSKTIPADRIVSMSVLYPAASICNAASKNTLAEKLLQKIYQLNQRWKICADKTDGGCSGINITVNCANQNEASLFRKKRESTEAFKVEINIPVKRDHVVDPDTNQKHEVTDVIQSEVLLKDLFNLEQVLPNGRPDLNAFKIEDQFRCQSGQIVVNDACVPCASGSYFNPETNECILCPIGQFQPENGQMTCMKCPQGKITTGPGAIKEDECKIHCKAGNFLHLDTNSCEPCGYGFYQPSSGSFTCIPCEVGKTTLSNQATTEDDCRDECPDGEHLTTSGTCQPCQLGTYRTKGVHKKCVDCPPGTTTENIRSTKRIQCNTPKCVAGQFLVTSSKQCQFCPRGTYQDESLQTNCKLCPTDHTTGAPGATHESQCYSTNQCATGEDNCSWHAVCIDQPDDNDIPTFQCKCKPGYKGNGTHCTDACSNFCLNDGVCKKNHLGFVECMCKENFSGERCEIRFQPRTQKIALITAGIGGVVLILIIIVIIIWMISFRFNRVDDFSLTEPEKPPVHLDSPLTSNFLYGRPTMDRPPSSLAGAGPGGVRPIGYYYEDEDEYDVKENGIFVGNEREPSGGNGNGPKDPLTQREFQERLRHVQQHSYRPGLNHQDE